MMGAASAAPFSFLEGEMARRKKAVPIMPVAPEPERKASVDTWMYGPEGARLFKAGEIIPSGYCDSPAKVDRK